MIKVLDKNGNELEPTYPKRARGLVKKGRARFIDDSTIVLEETQSNKTEACPPIDIPIDINVDVNSEDMKMFDNNEEKFNSINAYFGEIQITKTRAKSVCGSLTGTVIGAGASHNAYTAPFDGTYNSENLLDPNRGESVDRWFGLKMFEPVALTHIMVGTSKRKKHRIFGSLFQGSYDGVLWTTLAEFTEEDYIAYANNDKFYYRKEIENAVPYFYYRYFNVDDKGGNGLMALLLFGEDAELCNLDTFQSEITYTGVRAVSVNGSLSGEIIGAGGEAADYIGAFDGKTVTRSEFGINLGKAVRCWFGIKADEPTQLAKVTLCAPMAANRWYRRSHVIIDSYLQGSNDGINWTTLRHFTEEDYIAYHGKSAYYTAEVTDQGKYTYFRWFNYDDGGINALAELYLYAADAKTNNKDTYYGNITCTGVRSVSLYGSLSGEVIGAGADSKFAYLGAFDGNISTQTKLGINMGDGVSNWFGLKTDEPAAVVGVTVATLNGEKTHYIYGSLFQGSNDGVNWTTLAEFGEADYLVYANSGMRYYTKEITDTTEYTYFRYFNQNDIGGNCLAQLLLYTAENITGIRHLESNIQNGGEAAAAPAPEVNTAEDDELDLVKKYVESQMHAVNASMLDSRRDLFNLLVDGEITAEKYEEMLRVVEENCDRRILQLQKMLHDAVRKADQRVLDLNQSLKAYVKEQTDNVKKSCENKISSFEGLEDLEGDIEDLRGDIEDFQGDLEDLRGDLEDMIEDLKSEIFDRLDEMEEE